MAADVWFYHLERSGLETVLPELLEKTLGRGWRALVHTGLRERMVPLDQLLWTARDESFLPHGRADEADPDRQPVLLTDTGENLNQAQCLFAIDGAEPADPESYERTIILFDGQDEEAVARARQLWKRVAADGAQVSYWQQSPEGRWEKKA